MKGVKIKGRISTSFTSHEPKKKKAWEQFFALCEIEKFPAIHFNIREDLVSLFDYAWYHKSPRLILFEA